MTGNQNTTYSTSEKRAIGLVLIGALLLRLYQLNMESFWLDEAIIWHRIKDGPMKFLFDWDADTQGPTYAMFIWLWSRLFGVGEVAMRIPSVIFGVLSIHALYLLGRRVFGHPAALIAALFAAVNPFLMYYSQEARPYTLWLWSSLLAVWFLLRLIERDSRVNLIGTLAATIFSLYTHPYGPFLLALQALIIAVLVPFKEWKRFFGPALIIGVAYLPEAYIFLKSFVGKVHNKWSVAAWIHRPGLLEPWTYMKHYFAWYIAALASSLLLSIGLVYFRTRVREHRTGFVVCTALLIGMFGLPWLVSQLTPILWMRYTITALAAILLLMGWIVAQTKKPLQILAIGLFLVLNAVPLYHYYTKFDKDPWRQAVAWLIPQIASADHILVHPQRAPMPFEYYYRNLFQHDVVIPKDTTQIASLLPDSGTVWFVTATYSHSKPMRDAVYSVLAESCECDSTYRTAELYPRNPYLIFRADIEITRCRMREAPHAQP